MNQNTLTPTTAKTTVPFGSNSCHRLPAGFPKIYLACPKGSLFSGTKQGGGLRMRSPMMSPVWAQRFSVLLKGLYDGLRGLIRSSFPFPLWLRIPLLILSQAHEATFPSLQVAASGPSHVLITSDLWGSLPRLQVHQNITWWTPSRCHPYPALPAPFLSTTLPISPCSFALSIYNLLHCLGGQRLTDKWGEWAPWNLLASPRSEF